MIACYFGRRGEGKTTAMRQALASSAALLVHDPMRQWLADCVECPDRQSLFRELSAAHRRKVSFRLALCSADESDSAWLCTVATATRECDLAFDECDWSFSPSQVPKELRDVISYSRHYRIGIHAGARRPASVPRLLTSQADELTCFRLTEPRDVEYLQGYAGPEFAARVAALRRHESATWKSVADEDT